MIKQTLDITKHATTRLQQRGIRDIYIDFLFKCADCWEYAGGGSERVYISSREFKRLDAAGVIPANILSKIRRLCLIIKDNMVVTTLHKTRRMRRARVLAKIFGIITMYGDCNVQIEIAIMSLYRLCR